MKEIIIYNNPKNIPGEVARQLRSLSFRQYGTMCEVLSDLRKGHCTGKVCVVKHDNVIISWAIRVKYNKFETMCYTRKSCRRQGFGQMAVCAVGLGARDKTFEDSCPILTGHSRRRFWNKARNGMSIDIKNKMSDYVITTDPKGNDSACG